MLGASSNNIVVAWAGEIPPRYCWNIWNMYSSGSTVWEASRVPAAKASARMPNLLPVIKLSAKSASKRMNIMAEAFATYISELYQKNLNLSNGVSRSETGPTMSVSGMAAGLRLLELPLPIPSRESWL